MQNEILVLTGTAKEVQAEVNGYRVEFYVTVLSTTGKSDDFVMTIEIFPKETKE